LRTAFVIGIDAKDGMVAIEGWAKTSEFYCNRLCKEDGRAGCKKP